MIRFVALAVVIAAVVFVGLEAVDNGVNGVEGPEVVPEENISMPGSGENSSPAADGFPSVDTTYRIGPWTVVIAEGERSGFDSNWTLQAGIKSSNYSDRNRSIIYNCMRSYNLATGLNPMYENASNPCQELNRTLQGTP